MVNLVKAIMSTEKSDRKQMNWLKKQLKTNECDINKQRANLAPIHAAVIADNTKIVELIVKMKGVDVDAACKIEVNGKLLTRGVLDVAVKQPHPSIEIIKILLEFVKNPVLCDNIGIPGCIVVALGNEYYDILELFRGKACLLGAIDGSLFFKLASIVIRLGKPPLLRWMLQFPEVISFMDEGEEVKRNMRRRFLTFGLLEDAREHDQVEICELLTEFIGESLSELNGVAVDMSLNNINEVMEKSLEVMEKSVAGLDGDENGMSLKVDITEVIEESQGGLDGDEDRMSMKDCVPACVDPPKDNSKGANSTNVVAVKIKYCWNCENPSRYMCVGCRKARYCESSCQLEDWASHKDYCLVKMNKFAFKEFESISPSIFQ